MIVIKMIILIIKIFLIIVVISIMLISKQNIVLNVKLDIVRSNNGDIRSGIEQY